MSDHNEEFIKIGELENRPVYVRRDGLKLTEEDLFKLNKKEQSDIIKQEGEKVPRLEKDRVDKIIELKGGKK